MRSSDRGSASAVKRRIGPECDSCDRADSRRCTRRAHEAARALLVSCHRGGPSRLDPGRWPMPWERPRPLCARRLLPNASEARLHRRSPPRVPVVPVDGQRLTVQVDLRRLDPACFDTDEDVPYNQQRFQGNPWFDAKPPEREMVDSDTEGPGQAGLLAAGRNRSRSLTSRRSQPDRWPQAGSHTEEQLAPPPSRPSSFQARWWTHSPPMPPGC